MTRTFRVGVAGLVHDHVWGELPFWKGLANVELVAAADPHAELTERATREFGVAKTYASTEAMLAAEKLDVLQVCASNRDGVEAAVAAAARGLHCVVEKPMAHNLAGADRMLAAHRQAGTRLAINWPIYWRPAFQRACQMLSEGALGHVFHATIRMAHEGPREMGCSPYFYEWLYDPAQNGGGALIDYCCYGAALARQLFGPPREVVAVSARLVKTDIAVEDNAAITMLYDKRFAVTEASWCERPWYHDSIFRGTAGTLWTSHGKLFVDRSQQGGAPEEIACPPLASHLQNCPTYFLHCLTTGEPLAGMISPEVSRDAQEILEAGQRSAASGQRIALPLAPSP